MPTLMATPLTDVAPSIEDTTLKQVEVLIQESSLGTAGSLISAKLRNDFEGTRTFSLTCGYTFYPTVHDQNQKMILIQPLEFSMGALEWVTVYPITVCIEPDKEVPAREDYYSFGPMAEGNLKKLADCSCAKTISPDDTFALLTQQIAFWMVAWDKSSKDVITLTNQDFIIMLSSKGIDQVTIDSVRDYIRIFKANVSITMAACGL